MLEGEGERGTIREDDWWARRRFDGMMYGDMTQEK